MMMPFRLFKLSRLAARRGRDLRHYFHSSSACAGQSGHQQMLWLLKHLVAARTRPLALQTFAGSLHSNEKPLNAKLRGCHGLSVDVALLQIEFDVSISTSCFISPTISWSKPIAMRRVRYTHLNFLIYTRSTAVTACWLSTRSTSGMSSHKNSCAKFCTGSPTSLNP